MLLYHLSSIIAISCYAVLEHIVGGWMKYTKQAKKLWGSTSEYCEFEDKAKGRSIEVQKKLNVQMMSIFTDFGKMKNNAPNTSVVQEKVKQLSDFITEHYYTCSKDVLYGLVQMYVSSGDFSKNIDEVGGEGTAEFVFRAIRVYCGCDYYNEI